MSLNCSEFVEYDEVVECIEYTGGNSQMILVNQGVTIDPEDEASVQAAIDAGDAALIPNVSVGINDPEAIRIDSRIACQPQAVINYNRSAVITDGKVTDQNILFWNSNNASTGRRFGMAIIYSCSHNEQMVISAPILAIGGYINPQSDEEGQQFNLTLEWKYPSDPLKTAANPLFTA